MMRGGSGGSGGSGGKSKKLFENRKIFTHLVNIFYKSGAIGSVSLHSLHG